MAAGPIDPIRADAPVSQPLHLARIQHRTEQGAMASLDPRGGNNYLGRTHRSSFEIAAPYCDSGMQDLSPRSQI